MSLIAANVASPVLRSAASHHMVPRTQGRQGSITFGTSAPDGKIAVCDPAPFDPLPTQQVTPGSTVNVSFDISEEYRGRRFNVSSVLKLPGASEDAERIICTANYPLNETITEPFFQWTVSAYHTNTSLTHIDEFNTPGSSIIFSAVVLPEGNQTYENNSYSYPFFTTNNFTIVQQITDPSANGTVTGSNSTEKGAASPALDTPVGWKTGAVSGFLTLGLLFATFA